MKLKVLAGILGCVALMAGPAIATAQAPIPSSVVIGDSGPGANSGESFLIGIVSSHNPKCVAHRTIKVFAHHADSPPTLIDTSYSSNSGYWGAGGNFSDADGAIARMAAKTFGPKGHRRTCAASSDTF
jgi:hypothetical protein